MTLKIGVIGTGMIGRDHTRRIQQVLAGAEVVALSDVNLASAESVRADLAPQARLYDTGEALIAAPEVDAVLVTSWGATHEPYVLAAVAAGKPVFCEKPLAMDGKEGRAMVSAVEAAGTEPSSCAPITAKVVPASRSASVSPMQTTGTSPAATAASALANTSASCSPWSARRSEWPRIT